MQGFTIVKELDYPERGKGVPSPGLVVNTGSEHGFVRYFGSLTNDFSPKYADQTINCTYSVATVILYASVFFCKQPEVTYDPGCRHWLRNLCLIGEGAPIGGVEPIIVAEGVGFEPTDPTKGVNGFRDRPVRPLRHPSAGPKYAVKDDVRQV
jgi:hypothetical protein